MIVSTVDIEIKGLGLWVSDTKVPSSDLIRSDTWGGPCQYSIYVVNTLLQNSFSNTYLSRYSSVSLRYQCWNPDTILIGIDINQKVVTIYAKSKGMILNLFIKTGNHANTIRDLSTPLPLGAISLATNFGKNYESIPKFLFLISCQYFNQTKKLNIWI